MSALIIPTIGATGYYKLSAPFDSHMPVDEMYTCQAIRRIGDYISFNEDPLNDIYLKYGLTETDYEDDQAVNMYIISLQSNSGQWLYVPARFLLSYPIMNGVPYQSTMIGVALGAIPVNMDLAPIQTLIGNLIFENLGITPKMSPVVISKPVLVTREDHDTIEAARLVRATQKMSDYGRYKKTLLLLNAALQKLTILQNFIKAKHLANKILP